MNGAEPEVTPLFLAVLDGQDPAKCPLYDGNFSVVISSACEVACAKPLAVSDEVRGKYIVTLEAILTSPEKLLKEPRLTNVVGMVVDTLPKNGKTPDFAKRRQQIDEHVVELKRKNRHAPDAMFKRFGYRLWFVTDDDKAISNFVNDVRMSVERKLEGTFKRGAVFRDDLVLNKTLLEYMIRQYLGRVYLTLETGD